MLTTKSVSDILCKEGVSTQKSRVLIERNGADAIK